MSVGCCFALGGLQFSVVSGIAFTALFLVSGSHSRLSINWSRLCVVLLLRLKAWSQYDVCGCQFTKCISDLVSMSAVAVMFVYG
jgi:hypothetical protein